MLAVSHSIFSGKKRDFLFLREFRVSLFGVCHDNTNSELSTKWDETVLYNLICIMRKCSLAASLVGWSFAVEGFWALCANIYKCVCCYNHGYGITLKICLLYMLHVFLWPTMYMYFYTTQYSYYNVDIKSIGDFVTRNRVNTFLN